MAKAFKFLCCFAIVINTPFGSFAAEDLATNFPEKILPWMKSFPEGEFKSPAESDSLVTIRYRKIPAADQSKVKGVIIVSPGQSEPGLKYAEVFFDLRDLNYDIFVIDHRGQGASSRMLEEHEKSHVEKFSDYVDDFDFFVRNVVKPKENYAGGVSLLLAHSMGGAIAAGFLQRHPLAVDGVVLSAPMFEINTGRFSEGMATSMAFAMNLIPRDNNFAPSQGPYNPDLEFAKNRVTRSEDRFRMNKYLLNEHVGLRVGGTTNSWLLESLRFSQMIRAIPNLFQVPTRLLQAGADQFVMPEGQETICVGSPRFCKIVKVEGAEHELFMERDEIRSIALTELLSLLQELETSRSP